MNEWEKKQKFEYSKSLHIESRWKGEKTNEWTTIALENWKSMQMSSEHNPLPPFSLPMQCFSSQMQPLLCRSFFFFLDNFRPHAISMLELNSNNSTRVLALSSVCSTTFYDFFR